MPLSKRRNRIRMRRLRAAQRLLGDKDALRRRLWDMKLTIEAKEARITWQSSGIRGLQDKIATLEARLATQPAMADTASQQRIMALEAEMARLEAMLERVLHEARDEP